MRDGSATTFDELCTLAADTAASPSLGAPPESLLLSVRGHPLPDIVHLLASALLHQRRSAEEAAAATATRELQASVTQCASFAARVSSDLELERRPFPWSASPVSSSTQQGTLAEAVRHAVGDAQTTSRAVRVAAATALVERNQRRFLLQRLGPWQRLGERRVRAASAGAAAVKEVIAVYYLKWRTFAVVLRRLQRARERHARAVAYRARSTLLHKYWRTWTAATQSTRVEVSRLRAYQARLAAAWSLCGPAVTHQRLHCFERWRLWAASRAAPPPATASLESDENASPKPDNTALHAVFHHWMRLAQRRRLSQLHLRLSRVLAAQNGRALMLYHFRVWRSVVAESHRRQRLAVLSADAHKRRVTALARRYFHALRFHRREQQFQRMMRGVEGSLLVLGGRLTEVERAAGLASAVQVRAPPLMVGAASAPVLSPRLGTGQRPSVAETAAATHHTAVAPPEAWTPESERELLSRVEELLSRSV